MDYLGQSIATLAHSYTLDWAGWSVGCATECQPTGSGLDALEAPPPPTVTVQTLRLLRLGRETLRSNTFEESGLREAGPRL